ncbi:putative cytochrome P450 alkane hydroxylase [Acephala macrosclerotiorum]|nr:putative cytochrome P450 alkane hydroxylase [Acephala macrosclerotiorum]
METGTFTRSWALTIITLYFLYIVTKNLWTWRTNRRKAARLGCKPVQNPLPQWDPIFGFDMIVRGLRALRSHTILDQYHGIFQEHGNTIGMNVISQPIIQTIEPENVKTVLALGFSDFGLGPRRQHFLGPLVGHGIFITEGPAWKRSRQLLRPNLTNSQAKNLPMFESHIHHLLALIPKNGDTVDLQELFCRLTIDSGTELLFGTSCNSLCDDEHIDENKSFSKALDVAQSEMIIRDVLGPYLSIFRSEKRFRQSLKTVHDFIDGYVQVALASLREWESKEKDSEEERYIFLEELYKYTRDPVALRWETINVLIAGRDTTAVLMGNTWFILARRPDIWAKLKAEVDKLEGRLPTHQELTSMKYLRWLLSETLRLYPVLPINARTAMQDTTIPVGGGLKGQDPIFIPKGREVAWNTWSMHRRKDLFGEDADEFIPERWEHLRPMWEYLPFNGGPRICLGRKFPPIDLMKVYLLTLIAEKYALTEASYTTIRMVQHLKSIETRDPNPWTERIDLVTSSHNGCKVGVTWRDEFL